VSVRVAINGFGRIGRNVLRAVVEEGRSDVSVVAINDLAPADTNAHLLRYDSVHGRFPGEVRLEGDVLDCGIGPIKVLGERTIEDLPWQDLEVDVVLECTGVFTKRDAAARHLEAGARKVLVSAPSDGADLTVCYKVNHEALRQDHQVVSNASCTTNCLAPVAKVLNDAIGIETGAARAVGLVLPELKGKLDGVAFRVPTQNVSIVDLTFVPRRQTSAEEINQAIIAAADGPMAGVLGYHEAPLVSVDFNHDSHSSTVDLGATKVLGGKLARVASWYDNEWGFSCRMNDIAAILGTL
jgi:glyceraldehyde 3-phosphate dehydrogenase (phosphorylating)